MNTFVLKIGSLCDRLRVTFTRPSVTLATLLILAITATLPRSPADPDLFARVAMGRLVQTTGRVPMVDPFAFSPTLPIWVDHEWLSGVVFWSIASRWGDGGLILLKVALICLTTILIVRTTRVAASGTALNLFFLVICLGQGVYAWGSTIRCQTFTYLFLAYQLFALITHRERGTLRYVLTLPLLSIAWVNLHGGYALGMTFLWLWTLLSFTEGKRSWPLVGVATLSSAAPFFTPYGFITFLQYLLHALAMQRPSIAEWDPLWQHPPLFAGVLLLIGAIGYGVTRARDYRHNVVPLGMMLYGLYCGITHLRFVTASVLVCAVFGCRYFNLLVDDARRVFPLRLLRFERVLVLTGVFVVVMCLVTIARSSTRLATFSLDYSQYPVAAIQWLRDKGIEGRLLVDFNNGSFALWRLYPRMTISMDGRYEEVYSAESERLNSEALQLGTPESERALEILRPTHILISAHSDVPQDMSTSWSLIYKDQQYGILGHLSPTAPTPSNDAAPNKDMWSPLF